jgi:thioredoxin-related protein
MKKAITTLLITAALTFTSCAKNESKLETTDNQAKTEQTTASNSLKAEVARSSETTSKKEILFFMNPLGSPCQMQDQILKDMGNTLSDNASINYIKTTEMTKARPLFMQYGVRALPTMIVLNSDGSVAKRFTPGIIPAQSIHSAIN